ncbi:MAG: hypothetical protein GY851_09925, partial [bacterium]|nr:hypothetical protein [bacterium]
DIWATDGKPWTIGTSDETFQTAKRAVDACCAADCETFLKIAFDHHFEWFNDAAWSRAYNNFRQFAIFARDTGCTGIALDIEYVGEQYSFTWEGYDYDGYTRKELVSKIRERMTRVMSVMYDEFPTMVFLTFPEQGLSLGAHIHACWIEEAARRGAPGGIHYCTESTYRNPNINYMFAYPWAHNVVIQRILSDRAREYWLKKCTIASGVWPFGSDQFTDLRGPGMTLAEFKQAFAGSLMTSPRYNWLYGSRCIEQLIGRGLDEYTGDEDIEAHLRVFADKEVVIDPKYIALAEELRTNGLRDFAPDLGLMVAPQIVGPDDVPRVQLAKAGAYDEGQIDGLWDAALAYYRGEDVDLRERFGTQTHWMLCGPFPNPGMDFEGHNAVYPPEEGIDLAGVYDGLGGKARWLEHQQDGPLASVDLTKVFEPTERVCAYALCYVESPREMDVQVRLGTNDSGKLWLDGELVYDYPYEGGAVLDRDVVAVRLKKGTTQVLLKVCNGALNWGFVFRITDAAGNPVEGLGYSVRAPGTARSEEAGDGFF